MIIPLLLTLLGTCFAKCENDTLILFLTVPKCGSTLVQKVVSEIAREKEGYFLGEGTQVLLGLGIPHFRTQGRCIHHSHLIYIEGLYLRLERNASMRVFVNLRDPRDAVVSFRDYVEYKLESARAKGFLSLFGIDWEIWKKVSQYEKLELIIQSYYLDQFKRALEFIQLPNVCMVRYEYLVGDKGGGNNRFAVYEVKRILSFLGIEWENDRIEELVSKVYGSTHSFYKGRIGRGINEFTQELESVLKDRLTKKVYDQILALTSISHIEG